MATDDLTNRWAIRGDPARLREAAAALRAAPSEQPFGDFPGEHVVAGIARLLDSLAREMHNNSALSHGVVTAATDMSVHILAHLPRIENHK